MAVHQLKAYISPERLRPKNQSLHPSGTLIPHYSKAKDVTGPVLVTKVNHSYTAEAKKDKVQGEAVLEITIGTDGSVGDARVKKSVDPRLSEGAISVVN